MEMECDVCKNRKASVFLTQIVKGEMQKVNLCEGCAQERGVSDPTGFALAELLLGFGSGTKVEPPAPTELACTSCGMSHSVFRKTGRLGCAVCYDTFEEGMDQLLKAMHKGVRHCGRSPQGTQTAAPEPRPFTARSATPPTPPLLKTAPIPAVDPSPEAPPPPVLTKELQLHQLHAALASAVEAELFEEAARLRDEIRRIVSAPATRDA